MPIEFVYRNAYDTYLCFSPEATEINQLAKVNAHLMGNVIFAFTDYTKSTNYIMNCLLRLDIPEKMSPKWIYTNILNPYLKSTAKDDYLEISPFFVVDANTSYQITESAQLVTSRQIISYGFQESLIFNYYDDYFEKSAKDTINKMMDALRLNSLNNQNHTVIYSLKKNKFIQFEAIQ